MTDVEEPAAKRQCSNKSAARVETSADAFPAILRILAENDFIGTPELGAVGCVSRAWNAASLDDGLWSSLCHLRFPSIADMPPDVSRAQNGGHRGWFRRRAYQGGNYRDRYLDGDGGLDPPCMRCEDLVVLVDVFFKGKSILSRALSLEELRILQDRGSVDIDVSDPVVLEMTDEISSQEREYYRTHRNAPSSPGSSPGTPPYSPGSPPYTPPSPGSSPGTPPYSPGSPPYPPSPVSPLGPPPASPLPYFTHRDKRLYHLDDKHTSSFCASIEIADRNKLKARCVYKNANAIRDREPYVPIKGAGGTAEAFLRSMEFYDDVVNHLPLEPSATTLLERIVGSMASDRQAGFTDTITLIGGIFHLPRFCFGIKLLPEATSAISPFDAKSKSNITARILSARIMFVMRISHISAQDDMRGKGVSMGDVVVEEREKYMPRHSRKVKKHRVTMLHILDHLDWSCGK